MSAFVFRKATPQDIPFIIECILAAEGGGTPLISYQQIFGLSEAELRDFFLQLVGEELEGNEFSYANFYIGEMGGSAAAACAAWVEGAEGVPASTAKAQMLAHYLGLARWRAAADKLKAVAGIDIPRQEGALQIDSIAVRPSYRGQGLLQALLIHVMAQFKRKQPALRRAQILLMRENAAARRAYEKAGFMLASETQSADPVVPTLVPGTGRLMMEKNL